jgi:hypothetical protein
MLEMVNQGFNRALCSDSVSVGGKSNFKQSATRSLDIQRLAVNVAVTGELLTEETEEGRLIDGVFPNTMISKIWTLLVKSVTPLFAGSDANFRFALFPFHHSFKDELNQSSTIELNQISRLLNRNQP